MKTALLIFPLLLGLSWAAEENSIDLLQKQMDLVYAINNKDHDALVQLIHPANKSFHSPQLYYQSLLALLSQSVNVDDLFSMKTLDSSELTALGKHFSFPVTPTRQICFSNAKQGKKRTDIYLAPYRGELMVVFPALINKKVLIGKTGNAVENLHEAILAIEMALLGRLDRINNYDEIRVVSAP